MELRRFEPEEVATQLGAILGTEPGAGLIDLVFDRSGGNAYLVEELAAWCAAAATRLIFPRPWRMCC